VQERYTARVTGNLSQENTGLRKQKKTDTIKMNVVINYLLFYKNQCVKMVMPFKKWYIQTI
jgi:hypothetical protein